MGKGAIWMGIAFILFGLWLAYEIILDETSLWILLYPLLSIGIGIGLIVLYKEEDIIEKRKDLKEKKTK